MKHIILQSIAIAIIVIGGIFIFSTLQSTPKAQAKPGNECSYVPEKYRYFDFSEACQAHDDCYAERTLSRKRCDKIFYKDMKSICRELDEGYRRCRTTAYIYYKGVRLFGGPMYNQDTESRLYRLHRFYVKYLER